MKVEKQKSLLNSYSRSFEEHLAKHVNHGGKLPALSLRTVQINVGKRCNQACTHCHVEASPSRTEMMTRETAETCIKVISELPSITTVDITGGAPEMNENFRYLVEESVRLEKHVIDRCNLTILELADFSYLYDFLADNQVEIVASLPHYSKRSTNRQRGAGVFDISIGALRKLNQLGYGTTLPLNLVYNPIGLFLSSSQQQLEREFKENLQRRYGIIFNNLYCINNLPLGRFLANLERTGRFEEYMDVLAGAFNVSTVEGLMCRHQISVGYDGRIYDCDFNQMLDLTADSAGHIRDFDLDQFMSRQVKLGNHCYGCTAGSGSSCGGEISS